MDEKRRFNVIGQRIPNIEVFEKVTGDAKYTADIKLDRMLHGKILRSPHPHAKINHIGITRAKKLSGVVDVIVGKDIPQVRRSLRLRIYLKAQRSIPFKRLFWNVELSNAASVRPE